MTSEYIVKVKTEGIEKTKKEIEQLKKEISNAENEINQNNETILEAEEAMKQLASQGKKTSKEYQLLSSCVTELKEKNSAYKLQIAEINSELKSHEKELKKEEKELEEIQKSTQDTEISFQGLGSVFGRVTLATKSLGKGFKALGSAIASNPIGLAITAITFAVTKFKQAFDQSKQSAEDFASGLSKIKQEADEAQASLEKVRMGEDNYNELQQFKRTKEIDALNGFISSNGRQGANLMRSRYADLLSEAGINIDNKNAFDYLKQLRRAVELLTERRNALQYESDEYNLTKQKEFEINKEKILSELNKKSNKEQEDSTKQINSFFQKLEEDYYNTKYALRQRDIDNMKDSDAKKLAQIRLDYDKEIDLINRYEKEKIAEAEKIYGKGNVPKDVLNNVGEVVESRTQDAENKRDISISNVTASFIGEFSSFSKQMEQIELEYKQREQEILKQDGFSLSNSEQTQKLENLKKQKEKEFKALASKATELMKKNPKLAKALNWQEENTRSGIKSAEETLKNWKSFLESEIGSESYATYGKLLFGDNWEESAEAMRKDQEQVNEQLQETEKALSGISKTKSGISTIIADFKKLKDTDSLDFSSNVSKVVGYVNSVTSSISTITSKMHEIADITNNDSIEQKADRIDSVIENINAAGSGAATGASIGGGWGAIIGAVVGGLGNIATQWQTIKAENKAYNAELTEQYKDLAHQLHLINVEQEKLVNSFSIFGDTMTTDKVVNKNASVLFEELQTETRKAYLETLSLDNVFTQLFADSSNDLEKALKNMKLITNEETKGILFWKHTNVETESLLDTYPTLIDSQNRLNTEKAKEVLDSKTLTDESQAHLQAIYDATIAIEEQEETLTDYISSLFGNLSNDIADGIISAFQEGTNAGEEFAESVNDIGKTIEKNLISSMIASKLVDKYKNSIYSIYGLDENGKLIENNYSDDEKATLLLEQLTLMKGEAETLLQTTQGIHEQFVNAGIYSTNEATSGATTKGIAQASQDSIDELNGRFTAIQSHTFHISEQMQDFRERQGDILAHLNGIHTNTDDISKCLNNMKNNGVKIAR